LADFISPENGGISASFVINLRKEKMKPNYWIGISGGSAFLFVPYHRSIFGRLRFNSAMGNIDLLKR